MADPQLDEYDYYTLLGVEQTASDAELKAAFRKFALRYHPDRFAGAEADKVERATAIYRRGSEAIEVLGDPTQRRAYDAGLARGQLRLTSDPRAAKPQSPTHAATARAAPAEAPTIRSPSARAFYGKALELAKAGDARGAYRAIQSAMEHEPGNAILEEALRRVRQQIR
jgi:curved DNA-binding protein CbpA